MVFYVVCGANGYSLCSMLVAVDGDVVLLLVSGLSVFGPNYEAWISRIGRRIADVPTGFQHSAGRVLSCKNGCQQRARTLPFVRSEHSGFAEPGLQLWEPQGNRNVEAPFSNNKPSL
jgi:hypothetical protein